MEKRLAMAFERLECALAVRLKVVSTRHCSLSESG